MSKSAESDLSRINLLDSPDAIRNKVKRAKTDEHEGLEFDNPSRPEANNLLTIYSLMTGSSKVTITERATRPSTPKPCPSLINCPTVSSSSMTSRN